MEIEVPETIVCVDCGGQCKQRRLVFRDEPFENAQRCRKLSLQQRAAPLFCGQQDELPVDPVVVEVKRITQFVAHLGRVA